VDDKKLASACGMHAANMQPHDVAGALLQPFWEVPGAYLRQSALLTSTWQQHLCDKSGQVWGYATPMHDGWAIMAAAAVLRHDFW
jgi:hypothetical protein